MKLVNTGIMLVVLGLAASWSSEALSLEDIDPDSLDKLAKDIIGMENHAKTQFANFVGDLKDDIKTQLCQKLGETGNDVPCVCCAFVNIVFGPGIPFSVPTTEVYESTTLEPWNLNN